MGTVFIPIRWIQGGGVSTVPPKSELRAKKWNKDKVGLKLCVFLAHFTHTFCMCSFIITSFINKKSNGHIVILLACVAFLIHCHLKIVDKHSVAYKSVQTPEGPKGFTPAHQDPSELCSMEKLVAPSLSAARE